MDVDKLFKLVVDYLSDYVSTFTATLQDPSLRFPPVPDVISLDRRVEISPVSGAQPRPLRLNPRLFSFSVLSIFIGSTIHTLIPGAPAPPDFPTIVVIVLITWFFFSCMLFALDLSLGGPGTFWETISISLQVLSVMYVVSSFGALLWSALVHASPIRAALLWLPLRPLSLLVHQPVLAYFILQFLLLAVYLPLAMRRVHRLNRIAQFLIGVLALGIILISYTLYPNIRIILERTM